MFKFIICALIILNSLPTYADFITHSNHRPNTRTYRQKALQPMYYNDYNNFSNKDLNILEKYALNRTFKGENELQRLERLENLAFGATQYGDINSRFQNVENAILARPKYTQKRSVLNNLANYFIGQPTGFTPSITPYNNLGGFSSNPFLSIPSPGYDNQSFRQHSRGLFGGGGWSTTGSNYGTGSSIRILD